MRKKLTKEEEEIANKYLAGLGALAKLLVEKEYDVTRTAIFRCGMVVGMYIGGLSEKKVREIDRFLDEISTK